MQGCLFFSKKIYRGVSFLPKNIQGCLFLQQKFTPLAQLSLIYLLPQLELFTKDLDEAWVEDHDLAVLVVRQHLQVPLPLPGQVHFVQHPLGAVRRLPKISRHFVLTYQPQFTVLITAAVVSSLFSNGSQLLLPHSSSLPELVEVIQILLHLKTAIDCRWLCL